MATKISISKKFETKIREHVVDGCEVVEELLKLLDAVQTQKTEPGLSAQAFLGAMDPNKVVALPPSGPMAARTYARLTRTLKDYGVTIEHAEQLGRWMPTQRFPWVITIDRIILNLSDWLARAGAQKVEWEKPEW